MRVIISLLAVVSRDLPLLKRVRLSQEQKASEAHRDSSRDGRQGILSCGLTTACARPDKQNKGSRTATPSRSDRNAPGAHPGRHHGLSVPFRPTSHRTRACECTRRGSCDGSHCCTPLPVPSLAPHAISHRTRACARECTRRGSCDGSHCCTPLPVPKMAATPRDGGGSADSADSTLPRRSQGYND